MISRIVLAIRLRAAIQDLTRAIPWHLRSLSVAEHGYRETEDKSGSV